MFKKPLKIGRKKHKKYIIFQKNICKQDPGYVK